MILILLNDLKFFRIPHNASDVLYLRFLSREIESDPNLLIYADKSCRYRLRMSMEPAMGLAEVK